ncbi:MAG: hypothetical protein A2017_10990 [Lentisphaerae bacterium GWF2_44_16]|nr:MAG: hypothetical protein A2017_10990 [Lentisphaerae bacterium GWF2_44_16]
MKLHFINGPKAGEKFELGPPGVSIGRETDNDINLLIGGVSRYHAKLEPDGDGWLIRDLGSTNGSKVNGQIISGSYNLQPGDIITLGEQNICYGEKQPDASQKAAQQEKTILNPFPVINPSPSPIVTPLPEKPLFQPIEQTPRQEISPDAPEIIQPVPQAIFQPIGEPEKLNAEIPISPVAQTVNDMANPEKNENIKSFFDNLKKGETSFVKMNFFEKNEKGSGPDSNTAAHKDTKKRKFSNFLFYVLVIGAAVIFVSIFIMIQKTNEKKTIQKPVDKRQPGIPLLLSYSKQITTPDNIFNFFLKVEDGMAIFTLDDIKSQRHYSKTVKAVDKQFLENLEEKIKGTNFMSLQSESPGAASGDADNTRKLIIGYGKNLNDITVKNTFANSSFEEIEAAIDEFSENYGLRTISLTPEEMRQEADKSFAKAEQLFLNYDAKPENLREAIVRYKITMEMLDQFVPKPEKWNIARKKQQEAQTILDQKFKDLKFDFERFLKLNEYQQARDVCSQMMLMMPPDSKGYEQIKAYKLNLEKKIGSKNKK